ncbi:DUF4169 family protein [Ruegeria sp.]|uniref:DUF4169 family protein n=1 Tax=Ruegeria sp. TaxID=1879320 RepID=UPI002322A7E5|nr:DUF4169 family protein [Ruegeria sp.]MDA7964174.1 DUF4169 family protein [Ruegeria sp.]
MSTPINLNQYRKAKAKAAKKAQADENTVKFGRTKAEKDLTNRQSDKQRRDLDGHEVEE